LLNSGQWRDYEAEESSVFEAVAREWLLKTQQDGKCLSGRCGGLRVVEMAQ
jgi:hypothetical protein